MQAFFLVYSEVQQDIFSGAATLALETPVRAAGEVRRDASKFLPCFSRRFPMTVSGRVREETNGTTLHLPCTLNGGFQSTWHC
jgi:hypothetical protein